MATIGRVSAVFTASTSGLRTGINQATSSMARMEASTRSLAANMRILTAINIGGVFASAATFIAGSVRSLVDYGVAQANVIDDASKMAQRLGLTYGEFAGLALAADLAGVSMDQIGTAVTRAEVAFARAAQGSRQARDAFAGIGLSLEELNGLSAAERFDRIVQAIAALPTQAQQAAAAVAIFGRAGAQLLPLFQGGAAGIAEARAEAERFGLALTNTQASNVEEMNDSFTRARAVIDGVVRQVTAYLAPAISGIAQTFTDFVGSVGGANIGQSIGEGIIAGARYLASIGDYIITNVPKSFAYVQQVGTQWSTVWDTAGRVASVFSAVGRFLQGAFLAVVGSLTGVTQAILAVAREAAASLGFDTTGLDTALAGLQGFNEQINADILTAFNAAGENFNAALDTAVPQAGEQLAGPLVQTLDEATARARQAALDVDQAARTPIEIKPVVGIDLAPVKQAVEGIDSRSSEGLKAMFRIMRGDTGNDVQERIARAAERTADAVEDQDGVAFDVVDLAPAAGA